MNRRAFLRNAGLGVVPTFIGGLNISARSSPFLESLVSNDSDRVLVLIELNGGNDGLNTFVPLDNYDNLANARPSVIIPQNQLLEFTDTISLHPVMPRIRSLYDNGNLTLIQGVGYPNQNRSHFRSLDIWNTAVDADEYSNTGWIGRYLDDDFPGYPNDFPNSDCPDPFAITMGSSIINCQGVDSNFSHSILNVDNVEGLTEGVEIDLPNDCYGSEMTFLIDAFKKSNDYSERVFIASNEGSNAYNSYPDTPLGEQLKTVARLIDGGLETRIYIVKLSGFDLHDGQVIANDHTIGPHANLLSNLSESIFAFQEDIKGLGLEERVIGMTYSEFGRKIISNAGHGTDHGTAAPMMIFGSCITPGVIGDNPTIAAEVGEEEGVSMQFDFRSVYGSILMDWFNVPEEKVQMLLTSDFYYLPLIKNCQELPSSQHLSSIKPVFEIFDLSVYPNPFATSFTVSLELKDTMDVRIDLYDIVGKLVKQISNQTFVKGLHEIDIKGDNFASGVYFVRIQAGSTVKSIRVLKE